MLEYRCQKSGGDIDIGSESDGLRFDGCPQAGLYQTETGGPAEQGTTMALLYSDSALYARFFVEANRITAHYTENNAPLYEEDVVELFIEAPGTDGYFEVEFNPNSAVFFGKITFDGEEKHIAFLTGARCRAERTESGWNVVAEIPFSALGAVPKDGGFWKFNAYRVQTDEHGELKLYALNPTLCDSFHVPERFIPLRFE